MSSKFYQIMKNTTVSEIVRLQIAATFSGEEAALVIAELESNILPRLNGVGIVRVHLAIVELASGDVSKFYGRLRSAMKDWRNVLIAADLAGDNWRDVLRTRGILIGKYGSGDIS